MDDGSGKPGRRDVLEAGLLAGAAVLLEVPGAQAAKAPAARSTSAGPVELIVNGEKRSLTLEPRATLAEALREGLGLTGTKVGCERGACGACTVLVDGEPTASCMTFARDLAGRRITTIEGVAAGETLAPIQAAFVARDALQCGFCTPGMVMSCQALLESKREVTSEEIVRAVSGNLCRCGTYPKVFEAALAAAGKPAAGQLPAGLSTLAAAPAAGGGLGLMEKLKGAIKGGEATHLMVGMAGALVKGERILPKDEVKPWDGAARLEVVGQPTPRIDGPEKVTGKLRYAFDQHPPGMLHAAVVRSPHPHARIVSVDLAAAEAAPGVKAVLAVERVLGPAELRVKPTAQGRWPRVRYEGQAVAAVAALTPAQAEDAARLIKVEYEVYPAVSDLDRARAPGSPLVFDGPVEQPSTAGGGGAPKGLAQNGNVRGPFVRKRPEDADVDKALAASEVVLEASYRTEVQTHSAMETHGLVADFRPELLEVWASTQGIYSVRDELCAVFQLPEEKVLVHGAFCGGGFGAKFGAGNQGVIAALLSQKAKAPVRLFLDRRSEHLAVGNRPSSVQRLRVGAQKDGSFTAVDLDALGSAGCAAGAGCAGPVLNLYPFPVARAAEADVFLTAGPAAAFRAPGHPQGAFALEQAIDELAEKLGRDPVDLRDQNDPHPARREERRIGRERIGWAAARAGKPGQGAPGSRGALKRGVGFAQGLWYNFDGPVAEAIVEITKSQISVTSGVQDIGGGIRTAMAQVVAEVFGVPVKEVAVHIGDTSYPKGPPSGGSMTTQLLLPAVRIAAEQAREALLLKAPGRDVRAEMAKLGKNVIKGQGARTKDYEGWRDGPTTATIGGAQFAEVEVDTETGVVRVLKVVAVHDCGRPINRLAIESQINGGVIQGLSFALHEQRVLDRATGRMLNANLEQYRIAGARDVPVIEPIVVERFHGRSNVDASGIGEPATVPTAAAIANAIHHALGVRLREVPITPARVLAALGKVPGGGR